MGILRTAGRAYVATRVVGSTHRRQQQRWAAQDASQQMAAPIAPQTHAPVPHQVPGQQAPSSASVLDQLEQLGQLRTAGVLTEQEFEQQKQRILAGG